MPVLDTGIHRDSRAMDRRVKPGDDEKGLLGCWRRIL
jgi:hypothetical protein